MLSTGVLICSEAVPFVSLASVCRSLQGLISALTQAGGGGLLFRLLVPLRCGEDWHCFPRLRCSGSRLLYMERALRCRQFLGCSTEARNKKLSLCFVPCPAQAAQAARSLTGALSPVRRAFSPPRPQPQSPPAQVRSGACALRLAETLPADVEHPESQEVFG